MHDVFGIVGVPVGHRIMLDWNNVHNKTAYQQASSEFLCLVRVNVDFPVLAGLGKVCSSLPQIMES